MAFIRRDWTPQEADNWTKEDWLAIIISPLAYVCLTIGTALSILLMPAGFIWLGIGVVLIVLMHWIIDPKLKVVSEEFENKQHEYLEELNRKVRWEDDNG